MTDKTNIELFKDTFDALCVKHKLNKNECSTLAQIVRRGICIQTYQHINRNTLLVLGTPTQFKNNRLVDTSSYVPKVINWAKNSDLAIQLWEELNSFHLTAKEHSILGEMMFQAEIKINRI